MLLNIPGQQLPEEISAAFHFSSEPAMAECVNFGLPYEVTEYSLCLEQFHKQPLQRGEISLIFKETTSEEQAIISLNSWVWWLNPASPVSSPLCLT